MLAAVPQIEERMAVMEGRQHCELQLPAQRVKLTTVLDRTNELEVKKLDG